MPRQARVWRHESGQSPHLSLQPWVLSHKYPARNVKSSECPLKGACSFCKHTQTLTQKATQETHTRLHAVEIKKQRLGIKGWKSWHPSGISAPPLGSFSPGASAPDVSDLKHDFSAPHRTPSSLRLIGFQTGTSNKQHA